MLNSIEPLQVQQTLLWEAFERMKCFSRGKQVPRSLRGVIKYRIPLVSDSWHLKDFIYMVHVNQGFDTLSSKDYP